MGPARAGVARSGWPILTHNDSAGLKPGEYLLERLPSETIVTFSRSISAKLRSQVLDRNGFTCQMCDSLRLMRIHRRGGRSAYILVTSKIKVSAVRTNYQICERFVRRATRERRTSPAKSPPLSGCCRRYGEPDKMSRWLFIRGCIKNLGHLTDTISKKQRSANMRAVRSGNTQPEIRVRRIAYRLGYRFRLHRRDLPGSPDLVFPAQRKIIFVHGCFWHQHDKCRRATVPRSNVGFWRPKLARNEARCRTSCRREKARLACSRNLGMPNER